MLLWDRIQSTAGASLESLTEATFTRCRAWLLDRVNLDLDKLRLLLWLPQPLHHPHQIPRPAALLQPRHRRHQVPPRQILRTLAPLVNQKVALRGLVRRQLRPHRRNQLLHRRPPPRRPVVEHHRQHRRRQFPRIQRIVFPARAGMNLWGSLPSVARFILPRVIDFLAPTRDADILGWFPHGEGGPAGDTAKKEWPRSTPMPASIAW